MNELPGLHHQKRTHHLTCQIFKEKVLTQSSTVVLSVLFVY